MTKKERALELIGIIKDIMYNDNYVGLEWALDELQHIIIVDLAEIILPVFKRPQPTRLTDVGKDESD